MKKKNLFPNEEPSVNAEGKGRRLSEEELNMVTGGGYGQNEGTNNGQYLPNSAPKRPEK